MKSFWWLHYLSSDVQWLLKKAASEQDLIMGGFWMWPVLRRNGHLICFQVQYFPLLCVFSAPVKHRPTWALYFVLQQLVFKKKKKKRNNLLITCPLFCIITILSWCSNCHEDRVYTFDGVTIYCHCRIEVILFLVFFLSCSCLQWFERNEGECFVHWFGCPSHQVLSAGSRQLWLLCLVFCSCFPGCSVYSNFCQKDHDAEWSYCTYSASAIVFIRHSHKTII